MESDKNNYLKNFIIAVLICAAVGAVITIIIKQTKSKFSVDVPVEKNVDSAAANDVNDVNDANDATDTTTTDTTTTDTTTTDATTTDTTTTDTTAADVSDVNVRQISQDYKLENYEKPMLKNRTTNIIEHGNFVILHQTSDVLHHLQLNVVLTTMYFPTLRVYVVRGIYGESMVNCFVDSKTLEFVRVSDDYTSEPQLTKTGKKQKPNEPLEEVLKFDGKKQYYPDSLQPMIDDASESFLQRTTTNTYGVDSKRLY